MAPIVAVPLVELKPTGTLFFSGEVSATTAKISNTGEFGGKVTSASTEDTDSGTTLVTKDYLDGNGGSGSGFVKIAGDNMTGDLTLGTDKITLDASDGSATFLGDVTALSTNPTPNLPDATLLANGLVYGTRMESRNQLGQPTFVGSIVDTSDGSYENTVRIEADGSADFTSTVRSDAGFLVYPPTDDNYSFATRNATNTKWSAYITGVGDGIFDGKVEAGKPTDNDVGGVRIAKQGQLRVNYCGDDPEITAILLGLNGGQEKATIFADGSAKFGAGAALIKGDGSAEFAGGACTIFNQGSIKATSLEATDNVFVKAVAGVGALTVINESTNLSEFQVVTGDGTKIGYDVSTDPKITLDRSGSAEFAGGLTELSSDGIIFSGVIELQGDRNGSSTAISVRPTDASSGPSVEILQDGSATFDGSITNNSYIFSSRNEDDGTMSQVVLNSSNGAFPSVTGYGLAVQEQGAAAGDGCFISRGGDIEAGNSVVVNRGADAKGAIELNGTDGSATFAGNLNVQDFTLEAAFGYSNLKTGAIGFWSSDNWFFGPDVSDPTSAVISLDATNGSAEFDGEVESDLFTARPESDSFAAFQSITQDDIPKFFIYANGTMYAGPYSNGVPANQVYNIKGDTGEAYFKGDVTSDGTIGPLTSNQTTTLTTPQPLKSTLKLKAIQVL